jgi:FdhE protein
MPQPGPTEATIEAWVAAHPWLAAVARFHAEVDSVASLLAIPEAPVPFWEDYEADYQDGVPLLHSESAAIDPAPVAPVIRALIERLAARPLPEPLASQVRELAAAPARGGDAAGEAADRLFGEDGAGLARCLAWTVASRWLGRVVAAFARWRDEDRWLRNHCPTCGARPAMAQLVGVDPERIRMLACGRCRTRWRYRRTSCAFCDEAAERLSVLAVEGEPRLRIDSCGACRGYLKAYLGEGREDVFLADWTTLHLDVLAGDRGLARLAGSLYELPASLRGQG